MSGVALVLVDLGGTCVPGRAATDAAIAEMLGELGRGPGTAGELIASARVLWGSGPYYRYCLDVGMRLGYERDVHWVAKIRAHVER